MKKASLLALLLVASYTLMAADAAPAEKGSNLGAILFVVGIIVFLIVVRKLYDIRNRKAFDKSQAKNTRPRENIYEPRFWYQCKNCRVTIRKDSMPNSADCFQAPDHLWTQMAEVGTQKWLCRSCSTLIETRGVPVSENCPDAPMHDWERLP